MVLPPSATNRKQVLLDCLVGQSRRCFRLAWGVLRDVHAAGEAKRTVDHKDLPVVAQVHVRRAPRHQRRHEPVECADQPAQ